MTNREYFVWLVSGDRWLVVRAGLRKSWQAAPAVVD